MTNQPTFNSHTLRILLSQFGEGSPASVLSDMRKLAYHLDSCVKEQKQQTEDTFSLESTTDYVTLCNLFTKIHFQARNELNLMSEVQGILHSTHQLLLSYGEIPQEVVHAYLLACEGDEQRAFRLLRNGEQKPNVEDLEDNLLLEAMRAEKSAKGNDVLELLRTEEMYLKMLHDMEEQDRHYTQYLEMNGNILEDDDDEVQLVHESNPSTAMSPLDLDTALLREKSLMDKWSVEEQLKKSHFFCKGEEKYLAQNKYHSYSLKQSNLFDMSGEKIHFRIAESQFHRFLASTSAQHYSVTQVDYIVNPKIRTTFEEARKKLAEKHGFMLDSMKPLILFHGTSTQNMDSILKDNFLISKVGSTTDQGWWGRGLYFAEHPSLSIGYSRGNNALIVAMVLTGKAKKLQQVTIGCALTEGYDCHISSCGQEVVIFDTDCILPLYRVVYSPRT